MLFRVMLLLFMFVLTEQIMSSPKVTWAGIINIKEKKEAKGTTFKVEKTLYAAKVSWSPSSDAFDSDLRRGRFLHLEIVDEIDGWPITFYCRTLRINGDTVSFGKKKYNIQSGDDIKALITKVNQFYENK